MVFVEWFLIEADSVSRSEHANHNNITASLSFLVSNVRFVLGSKSLPLLLTVVWPNAFFFLFGSKGRRWMFNEYGLRGGIAERRAKHRKQGQSKTSLLINSAHYRKCLCLTPSGNPLAIPIPPRLGPLLVVRSLPSQ